MKANALIGGRSVALTLRVRTAITRSVMATLAAAALVLPGCQQAPAENKKEVKLPSVTVSYPVASAVVDYEEFTGRVDAVNKVGIEAMVTGYLDDIKFKDGDE